MRSNLHTEAISASIDKPNLMAILTAASLSTGKDPGSAKSTLFAFEFGFAPKVAGADEKILDLVANWT